MAGDSMGWGFDGHPFSAWGQGPPQPNPSSDWGRDPHSRTPVRPVRPSWARGCVAPATSHRARWGSMATPGHGGGRGPKGHRGGRGPHNPSTKRRTLVRPGPIPLKPRISPPPSISRGLDERSLSVLASKQLVRRDAKPSQWGSKPSSDPGKFLCPHAKQLYSNEAQLTRSKIAIHRVLAILLPPHASPSKA